MKSLFLLLTLSILSRVSEAQTYITAGLNSWRRYSEQNQTDDSLVKIANRNTIAIPSIGYFKTLRGGTGAGVEIGLAKQRSTYDNKINFDLYSSQTIIKHEEVKLYVCPTVFELLKYKKYVIMVSAALPIEYDIKRKDHYHFDEIDKATNNVTYVVDRYISLPNFLQVSLAARASIQRHLYGRLYLGAHGSVAFTNQFLFGTTTIREIAAGGAPRYELIRETKNSSYTSFFEFIPAFFVSYRL